MSEAIEPATTIAGVEDGRARVCEMPLVVVVVVVVVIIIITGLVSLSRVPPYDRNARLDRQPQEHSWAKAGLPRCRHSTRPDRKPMGEPTIIVIIIIITCAFAFESKEAPQKASLTHPPTIAISPSLPAALSHRQWHD